MGSGVSFDFLTRSMFISWLGPAVCMVLKFRRQRLISARAAHQNAWKESVLAVAAIKKAHVLYSKHMCLQFATAFFLPLPL